MTQTFFPVIFAGAGPGAAQHLTLGVYQALQGADVVIHDRLVGAEVLSLIPPHVRLMDVGKEGFGPSTAQSVINATLVQQAQTGARVVRLKGGDCGIFGRLDEEIAALEAAKLTYSIRSHGRECGSSLDRAKSYAAWPQCQPADRHRSRYGRVC